MTKLAALISRAERMLATASTFEEVKLLHAQIEALRVFAKKVGADTRKLGEIKIECEARLGEEIAKGSADFFKPPRHRKTMPLPWESFTKAIISSRGHGRKN